MLFVTHLVVGALLGRWRGHTAWVVAGAVLPDVVDKPLAAAGVVPLYHSVVHATLFGTVFAAGWLLARRDDRAAAAEAIHGATVGWASHLAADAFHVVLNGRPADAAFLFWPIVRTWPSIEPGPVPFVVRYLWTPSFVIEVGIWALAGGVAVRSLRGRRDR